MILISSFSSVVLGTPTPTQTTPLCPEARQKQKSFYQNVDSCTLQKRSWLGNKPSIKILI